MINMLPYNLKNFNEYNYYHVSIFFGEKVISNYFDITLEKATNIVNSITGNLDFKVVGTLKPIDDCVDYVNRCLDKGIVNVISREDVFETDYQIFVDCTDYFRN